jgi:hypothetical protein
LHQLERTARVDAELDMNVAVRGEKEKRNVLAYDHMPPDRPRCLDGC